MFFDEISSTIDHLVSILVNDEFVYIKNLGLEINQYRKGIEKKLSTENISIAAPTYQSEINSIMHKALTEFSPSAAGKKILAVENYLETKKSIIPNHLLDLFNNFISNIMAIVTHIENIKFKNSGNIVDLSNLIDIYTNLKNQIENYKLGVVESKDLISNKFELTENENIIQISFFSGINNFQIHVRISQMLDFCYNSLCQGFGIDYSKNPLKIITFYNGSDNYELVGEKTIIAFLSKLFEGAGNYLYENYTKAGEFKKLSGQFKDIINNLKLLNELTEMGIDIDKPKEIFRNSLIQIAKKIEENITYQYKMSINGKNIQLIPESQKQLEYNVQLIGNNIDTVG